MNVDRLVEQARELATNESLRSTHFGPAGEERTLSSLLAGLADAVGEHTDCVPADKVVIHSDLDGRLHVSTLVRERNAARDRVAALEAGIRVHRDVIRARDRNNPPHIHLGTSAQSPNERLWALLDGRVPSTGQETT